ncbi:hypothetical protein OAW_00700 [Vibrio cyclitrophicus ZF170]|uniref:hypothetical protein n=1 Tax=Vibrio cyclitrophicus TaxID=47951 RepID=UPI0002DE7769|nr:hypothetical protein [Vibrio cyclitrophicus]OEE24991.1 hypothetical protein OAW_00700 [Vibrio cyclitrophicus ZF170]
MKKPFKKVVADKYYKLTLGRRQAEKMTEVTNLVNETPETFIKNATIQRAKNIITVTASEDNK